MADRAEQAGSAGQSRYSLLWRPVEVVKRGRPPRVSRQEVIDAAVAIADADGLDAVSMRSVARALRVGAMTLYSYVPGRVELVDAMVDRAYADFELPDAGLAWRPALEQYARGYWSLLRAHAWLLDVNHWRLPLAPHVLDADEAGYRILIDTGLAALEVVRTIAVLNNTVAGFARWAAVEAADERIQGTDQAHWAGTAEFWTTDFDPARFPSMTRLWTAGAFDDTGGPFDLQIESLLDTLQLLVDRARAEGPAQIPSYDQCLERFAEGTAEAGGGPTSAAG